MRIMGSKFRSTEHLMWWVLVGSRGGPTRARILKLLSEKPTNANQISTSLGLNYRTVSHHLRVLLENGLIVAEGPDYGMLYFPSKGFQQNMDMFIKLIEPRRGLDRKRGVLG